MRWRKDYTMGKIKYREKMKLQTGKCVLEENDWVFKIIEEISTFLYAGSPVEVVSQIVESEEGNP